MTAVATSSRGNDPDQAPAWDGRQIPVENGS
jgi:hypothetical protein